mgnify:CR=1 FL=1
MHDSGVPDMYEVHVLNMNPFPLLTGFACKVSSGFEFQVKSCLFWKLVLIWSCHPHHSNRGRENYWKSWVQIPATERWFVCPFADYFQICHYHNPFDKFYHHSNMSNQDLSQFQFFNSIHLLINSSFILLFWIQAFIRAPSQRNWAIRAKMCQS